MSLNSDERHISSNIREYAIVYFLYSKNNLFCNEKKNYIIQSIFLSVTIFAYITQ